MNSLVPAKNYEFRLSQLAKTMDHSLKKWSKKGGEPTLSEVAESVRGWHKTLDNMAAFDNINSTNFQIAQTKMLAAWNVRDDRKKCIAEVDETLKALKAIPEEMSQPMAVDSYTRRNTKSLFGDVASQYAHDPQLYEELYPIRRQTAAFAGYQGQIDRRQIAGVKTALINIVNRYGNQSVIGQGAAQAVKALDYAMVSKSRQAASNFFNEALAHIDTVGQAAMPQGYKSELTGANAQSVDGEVETLQDMFYGYRFATPAQFLPNAIGQTRRVIKAVTEHYDPKALRLARSIEDHLLNAQQNANHPATKSLGDAGWQFGLVSNPMNAALGQLDALDRHLHDRF